MELKVIALKSWKFDSIIMTQHPMMSKLKSNSIGAVAMDMDTERGEDVWIKDEVRARV